MGQRYADEGKIHHQLHPVPLTLSVFYTLNDWISCNDDFCPDNYNYSRFKLQDKCRSEKWELYLYSDMTIKMDRVSVEVLPRVCLRSVFHPTWQWFTLHL